MPFRSVRETKLQSFQVKLSYRILPCNKFLWNIRIKSDNVCSFCARTDTLEHFLLECSLTQKLWNNLTAWLASEIDLDLEFSKEEFFLGVNFENPNARIKNALVLFFKYYVYQQKLFHNGDFSLVSLLSEIQMKPTCEKFILANQNKLHKFVCWERLYMTRLQLSCMPIMTLPAKLIL